MAVSIPPEWMPADLEAVTVCPVCASKDLVPTVTATRDRNVSGGDRRWRHLWCSRCRVALLSPRPRAEALAKAYATYYTHREPVLDPRSEAERSGLAWRLLDGYLGVEYGYGSPRDLGRLGWLVARAARGPRATADRFVRNLARPLADGEQRLLDVGCGNGEFLLRMRQLGWGVSGVETDPVSAGVGQAAGLDVHVGEVPDGDLPGAPFDAVTLSHVIEHVADPIALLERCRRLMRPGGVIWVLTPNLDAPGARRYASDWVSWDAPRHLVIFTRAALIRALAEAGFSSPRQQLPLINARSWIYPVCEDVRAGGNGESPMPLPRGVGFGARLSDLAVALGNTTRAEELCLTATVG